MRKTKRRGPGLRIETLEDRRVPATWGIPWADPQHLTASFVPDGTSLPGGTSNLYQILDGQLGAGNWETPILKALQTWAVNSNINIGLVTDGGEPLGVAGLAQGDARFGDIRIGAEPLSSDVLAITTPYSPGGGTLSGDIIINSNDDFNPNDAGSYDLYTVILHEAGHVFGFADSSDPSSFMYNVYQGTQAGLPDAAVTALQNLYGGPRDIDAIDGNAVSTSPSSSVVMPALSATTGTVSMPGDIATAQTSNDFTFTTPATSILTSPTMDLTVQTAGLSLLTPKLTVYSITATGALGPVVARSSASSPLDGGTSVQLGGLIGGQKYVVQVQGATDDVFSVGSYDLTLSAEGVSLATSSPIAGAVPVAEASNYSGALPLTVTDSITSGHQVDVYSFKTPASIASVLNSVTVGLQDWGFGLVAPSVTVYDALGLAVGSATASSPASPSATVRLTSLTPNTTYYIRVTDGTTNAMDQGTYQVTIGFGTSGASEVNGFIPADPLYGSPVTGVANTTLATAATLQTPIDEAPDSRYEAIDGVTPADPARFYNLTAPTSTSGQPVVMTVSVQTLGTSSLAPWITVYDQDGNPLNAQSLTEEDGIAVVQVTLPNPGAMYTVEVTSSTQPGASPGGNYLLDTTFGSTMAVNGPLASGTLAASPAGSSTPVVSTTLTISQGELYYFDLAGSAANPSTDAMIQMTLLDSSGNVVATLSTPASFAESELTFLAPGNYTIEIDASSPSGAAIPALSYTLNGSNDTDPMKGVVSTGSGGGSK